MSKQVTQQVTKPATKPQNKHVSKRNPLPIVVFAAIVMAVLSVTVSDFFLNESTIIPGSEAFSKVAAFSIFGVGIGQSQIIVTGVVVALTVVLTYRIATRGDRYDQ